MHAPLQPEQGPCRAEDFPSIQLDDYSASTTTVRAKEDEMLIECKICGSENDVKDDMGGRCYNCDNDLPIKGRSTSRSGQKEGRHGSIYTFFAASYAFIFTLGLGGYLLSLLDGDPQVQADPFCLFLTMIAVAHLIFVKRVQNIAGVYKGEKRFNLLRIILLYGVVSLIIYHIATTDEPGDKNKVFYLMMMVPSLMLFYTYYFGKKSNSFFYECEARRRRGRT